MKKIDIIMNRTTKFRIWSKKHQMFDSDPRWPNNQRSWDFRFLDSGGNVVIFATGNDEEYYKYEDKEKDLIVQLFTGVLDKNGKEIYEGDIIRLIDKITLDGIVSFIAGMFVLDFPDQTDSGPIGFLETLGMEVIGNIFENPELLKNNQF